MRVWSVNHDGGKLLFLGEGDAGYTVTSVACGADNLIVSGCSDGSIHMWQVGNAGFLDLYGSMRHGEEASGVTVQSVCLSACDTILASSGGDSLIRVWRVQDRSMLAVLRGHGANVTAICFADAPDSSVGIQVKDAATMLENGEGGGPGADGAGVGVVRWAGTWLVSGSCDYSIKVWDVSSLLASAQAAKGQGLLESRLSHC